MLTLHDGGRRLPTAGRADAAGHWLWRHLNLDLAPGDRLAIVGPSGSGKTLLLRALAGLDALDAGTVALNGRTLGDWARPRYRAQVAYLPQTPALPEGTVEAALRQPFAFGVHAGKAFDHDAIAARLRALDRDADFSARTTDVLSGGERQIVAFLRTLQLGPRVLLLDEPTASLDAANTGRIEHLVTDWMDAHAERAVLWTSHDPAQLARVTDRRLDLADFEP
ncbi:MAG: ATP-binding cassette domain-containing protein [Bacteroidota bacterium]